MGKIISTMTGMVAQIHVSEGEKITVGQEVMIVESMKMHIPIESDVEGEVAEIKVNIGDFINEGDTLILLK